MTNNEAQTILSAYDLWDQEDGRCGLLTYPDGLRHLVQVLDCRQVYGRTDLEVGTPYTNTTIWVSIDRVKPLA